MREIVSIQAGQCGNQIGTKVRQILLILFTKLGWETELGLGQEIRLLKRIKINF